MSVLIAYGSAHGSTKEIAERIAARIRLVVPPDAVSVQDMKEAPREPTAQAMVIGSAIHAGRVRNRFSETFPKSTTRNKITQEMKENRH
jgi:menaquinone-dependent protoporphyrinogen IX oxidase